jgi:hypothetical protein
MKTERLLEIAKKLYVNYKPQLMDLDFVDEVIIHDCQYYWDIDLNEVELKYIKALITSFLCKKEIMKNESSRKNK